MGYGDHSILNSELAVKVLSSIASEEKGSYGSSIADDLNKSQASIGRIICDLREIGFVEKGERKQAQYYSLDYQGMADYWYNYIYETLEKDDSVIDKSEWMSEGKITPSELLDGLEDNSSKIKSTVSDYFKKILEDGSLDDITLSEMMFEGIMYSIGHNIIRDDDFLEENSFLEPPKDALIHIRNMSGFPEALKEVLE